MTMRSRSEPAVISRLPSRPKATIAAAPLGSRPCCRSNSASRPREERAHDRLREVGERLARLGRRRACRSAARPRSGSAARRRRAARGRARPRSSALPQGFASSAASIVARPPRSPSARRVEQRVGDMRAAREDFGEPRRGARGSWRGGRAGRDCCGSSAKSCAPAGSAFSRLSKARTAASGLPARANASSSAGVISVRLSRAAVERIAAKRPKCQPRTVSVTFSGSAKPSSRSVSSVSGSSSPPVKTRLPARRRKLWRALEKLANSAAPPSPAIAADPPRRPPHRHSASAGAIRASSARSARHRVRLLVAHHLQAVLDVAQDARRPRRARRAPPRRSSPSRRASPASRASACRAAPGRGRRRSAAASARRTRSRGCRRGRA